MIYGRGVGNIDWRGDWKGKRALDIGSGPEGHSCVDGSDNVRVLWEVIRFLVMLVQNTQLGYMGGKTLNHQWFENVCSFQKGVGQTLGHFICCKCLMSSFILDNCCWRATGLVSKGAGYCVQGGFIAYLRLYISV